MFSIGHTDPMRLLDGNNVIYEHLGRDPPKYDGLGQLNGVPRSSVPR